MTVHYEPTLCEYRLDRVTVSPASVLDIGANVGKFTLSVKHLWPDAKVLAVEPHKESVLTLLNNVGDLAGVQVLHVALGSGPMHFCPGSVPSHHRYVPKSRIRDVDTPVPVDIKFYSLLELMKMMPEGEPRFVKIDTEGAENEVVDNPDQLAALADFDYFTMEIHGSLERKWFREIRRGLLIETHEVDVTVTAGGLMIYGTKRRK